MDSICGVADAQGFSVKGEFVICELSFDNFKYNLHRAFKPDISWTRISSKEYKTLQFTRDNIHGLDLHPDEDLMGSSKARLVIVEFFRQIHEEGKFIGIKNNQLEQELKLLKISYKRLDDAPKLSTLDENLNDLKPWTCIYHMKIDVPTPRCTMRKCFHLWSWVENCKISPFYI